MLAKSLPLENILIRQTLQDRLQLGVEPAMEFLYTRYSAMLFGYILQFLPEQEEAEAALVKVFRYVSGHLEDLRASPLGVYAWLQIEARKIILDCKKENAPTPLSDALSPLQLKASYFSLLHDVSDEHKLVFCELFLNGRSKEAVAKRIQKDIPTVTLILRECLQTLRKRLS